MTDFQNRFDRCVQLFSQARDKDGLELSMYAFAADSGDQRSHYTFETDDRDADLRSVSKVVVGLVLGALLEKGIAVGGEPLDPSTPVEPLLRRHMSVGARERWSGVRIIDLLNNTIGHERGFLFRKDLGALPENEYLEYVFDKPIVHPPGAHFSYSNVGPFLFSVIVQDWLGDSLHNLSSALVLGPLGIESNWREFGEFTAGCTGLTMKNSDLIKLAALLRDRGRYGGTAIVPPTWVDAMSSPISLSPHMFDPARVFPKYAYGIGLWVCDNGSYYCDGTNGQYLIVIPAGGFALSTTGEQPDMKPITRCMIPFTEE